MAIWWRTRIGNSGLASVVLGALVYFAAAGIPAAQATSKSDLIFWRDESTGYAIGGFDPVAYFVDTRPRMGVRDYEYDWHGVTWRFVSAANRAVFVRDPTVYAPQYGGYGAESVAQGVLAAGSPAEWLIYQDRLFLFANTRQRDKWLTQIDSRRRAASRNWPRINGALVRN
ncbi:MAG: YHS domain-containing (seleno)protein [Hyphomicrobiales bacterium]